MRYASKDLQENYEIVMAAVQQDELALEHAATAMQGDKFIVMAAVQHEGLALETWRYVPHELKQESEILRTVCQKMGWPIPAEETNDNTSILTAMAKQNDKDAVLVAVQADGDVLRLAQEEMKRDRKLCTAAVTHAPLRPRPKEKRTGEFLRVRGPSISIGVSSWNECGPGHEFSIYEAYKVDAEEQLFHLKDNKKTGPEGSPLERGGDVRFLDDSLAKFPQNVQEAMGQLRKDGLALKDFPALSANYGVVMAAVKQDGLALQYLKPFIVHM